MAVTLPEERVLELFALFSDLEGDQLDRWRGLCLTAASRVAARLREGADVAGETEALCAAAAAWAYCDYLMVQAAGGSAEEIRVGDITIKNSGGQDGRDAEEIRDHFLAQVAHLLRTDCPLIAAGGSL